MKVRCVCCDNKFEVAPENFSSHEIIFCPICGLDHEIIKKTSHATVKSIAFA